MTPLFSLDISQLSESHVREFLALEFPEARRPVEGTTLDFKRELPDDIGADVAAMANSYGGLILVGVETRKNNRLTTPTALPGFQPNVPEIKAHITSKILSTVRPRPQYDIHSIAIGSAGAVAVVIRVAEGVMPPYEYEKGTDLRVQLRIQDTNRRATVREIEELFRKRDILSRPPEAMAPAFIAPDSFFAKFHPPDYDARETNFIRLTAIPRGNAAVRLDREADRIIETAVREIFQVPCPDIRLARGKFIQMEVFRRTEQGPVRHQAWRAWASGMIEYTASLGEERPVPLELIASDYVSFFRLIAGLFEGRGFFGTAAVTVSIACPAARVRPPFPAHDSAGLFGSPNDDAPERSVWCPDNCTLTEVVDTGTMADPENLVADLIQYQLRETWGTSMDHGQLLAVIRQFPP